MNDALGGLTSQPVAPELIGVPRLDKRLQKRYQQLVKEHAQIGQSLAAGLNALPGSGNSFASTQAAWRFYQNETTTLPALAQPLIEHARAAIGQSCQHYGLVMHDWSHLNYSHRGKKDCLKEGKKKRGYELQSALLVSDRAGQPLAPLCQNMVTAKGIHSTRGGQILAAESHLDELTQRMQYLEGLSLARPLVHIVDREGDSVGHYRQWQPHLFLVRVKGGQWVEWEGQKYLLQEVARQLKQSGALVYTREVEFRSCAARQYVGSTMVVIKRAARPQRKGQKRQVIAGPPVTLRLVVSEVRNEAGQVLATWLLLTNLNLQVDGGEVALWYYWRWRIESFFKLLKTAGMQIEHWQQEHGLAVAKRLLVVSMACVVIWRLSRSPDPAAAELRRMLVRLSGRQIKYGQSFTLPALLEGTWILLAMLNLLEHCDLSRLNHLAKTYLGHK